MRCAPAGTHRTSLGLLFLTALLVACDQRQPTAAPTAPSTKPSFVYLAPGSIAQISTGRHHACAVRTDGGLVCWGSNTYLDQPYGQATPPQELGPVFQVSAGGAHTCVIKVDRSVACWGNNGSGQASPPGDLGSVTQVVTGDSHSCAIKTSGALACWGNSFYGQSAPPSDLGSVTQVSTSYLHTCALRLDRTVACWGNNSAGQASPPVDLGTLIQVSAGAEHSCALKSDGTVACWGRIAFGDLNPPSGLSNVTQISAGADYTCAVSNGTLRCWGGNFFGEATPPGDLGGVRQVTAGTGYTCAITLAGMLACWGEDFASNASPPTSNDLVDLSVGVGGGEPEHVCTVTATGAVHCSGAIFPTDRPPSNLGAVTQVSTGRAHACVLKVDGTVACWGSNYGGLSTPPADLVNVTQISASSGHNCAVAAGTVRCWGLNNFGQSVPPPDLGSVQQVSAGEAWTCAVRTDGTVTCWGSNGFATPPSDLGTVRQVSAGDFYSCAIKTDGAVTCWGAPTGSSPPPDLGAVSDISVGTGACAVRVDGTLVCWGGITPPANLGTVLRVSSRGGSTCAIVSDHSLACWGRISVAQSEPPTDPSYTPPGSDVQVTPPDQTTGQPSPVNVTFPEVTEPGTTTVTSGTVGGGGGPPPPSNFRLGSPPTYYDIQTTAGVTPPITVCITWTEGTYNNERQLKLLHYQNGSWQNVTLAGYPDTQNNKICGEVSSLSPFLIAEQNVAPSITSLTLPTDPRPVGAFVSISATFTDANPGDVHSSIINWDDGSVSAGVVVETSGSGNVSGSHVYSSAGVYTIAVTASDGDLTGTRTSADNVPAYVVVYDPSAGFVTGGGWIVSPAGSYAPDPALAGKASFGFVAKYVKGANAPSGSTEFQFQTARFAFQSTSYQWLVVAGARAQFKGEGSINGGPTVYAFLLTAVDGEANGGGGSDRFRIKMWDRNSGAVIYDNQRGAAEDADAATALGGGSIVIHQR